MQNLDTALHRLGRQSEQYAEARECEDGALDELLQGVATYGGGACNPSVPYHREQISWPSSSSPPVDLSISRASRRRRACGIGGAKCEDHRWGQKSSRLQRARGGL
eukprot:6122440-Pyramimonas_sp.AAC.1